MLQRLADLAQIISLLPAFYAAYGAWVTLHPVEHPGGPIPSNATGMLHPGYIVSLLSFVILFAAGAFMQLLARRNLKSHSATNNGATESVKVIPQLTIHSAFYGTGHLDDRNVIEQLKKHGMDGLVIQVDNNTLGCDPAPGRQKRLRVTYSYVNDAILEISRPEYSRLVLPEDKEIIESTAAEYERKRTADVEQYQREVKEGQEHIRLLNWRLQAHEDSVSVKSVQGDVQRLADRLTQLLNRATVLNAIPNFELSNLLRAPLSSVNPLYADSMGKIDVWRFQEDYTSLRQRLAPYSSLSLDMLMHAVPTGISAEELQGVFNRTSIKLAAHVASFFVTSASSTNS